MSENKTNKFLDFLAKPFGFSKGYTPTSGAIRATVPRNINRRPDDPFAGAWQRNLYLSSEDNLTYSAVFAAISLIASDVAKLPLRLERFNKTSKIWEETTSPAFSPILKNPNNYQTRFSFIENWLVSILSTGNAYILKERDERNIVTSFHVLEPSLVSVVVADDGSTIFYEVSPQHLSGKNSITNKVRIPSSEIMHDLINPFYHKRQGLSPICASALAVSQGRKILENSANFFANNSRPGGVLSAVGAVSDETVEQLRAYWESNYTGNNAGKVAVLADGLTYKSFDSISAADSQVIDQLNYSSATVASVFRIPRIKLGIGDIPAGSSLAELNASYYESVIQATLERMELLLDRGLNLPSDLRTSFDENELLRMNYSALAEAEVKLVQAGIKKLNESRVAFNLAPMEGGGAYLQMQNFSVEALSRRDSLENPFAVATNQTPPPAPAPTAPEAEVSEEEKFALMDIIKSFNPKGKSNE